MWIIWNNCLGDGYPTAKVRSPTNPVSGTQTPESVLVQSWSVAGGGGLYLPSKNYKMMMIVLRDSRDG